MRKFLFALVLLFGVFFLIGRYAEMQDILTILTHGKISYIALALLVEVAWVFVVGLTYQAIYTRMGMPVGAFYMARVATAASFINVVAPAGGLSSMALFISTAKDDGRSVARATVASVLFLWLDYGATLVVLTFGLGEIARRNNLNWSEVTASLILLAGALAIGGLLYLGTISSVLLARVLAGGARTINRIVRPLIKRDYLSTERAYSFALELSEGISVLKGKPAVLLRPVLLALINKILLTIVLGLTFLAFDVPVNLGTVVAGFSIAYLFLIVSPTPAGLGIVEGILTVALRTLEVPIDSAAVITLAYRGITFWLPLVAGMVTIRTLKR